MNIHKKVEGNGKGPGAMRARLGPTTLDIVTDYDDGETGQLKVGRQEFLHCFVCQASQGGHIGFARHTNVDELVDQPLEGRIQRNKPGPKLV